MTNLWNWVVLSLNLTTFTYPDYIYTWLKLYIYVVPLNEVFIYHARCVYEMYNMASDVLRSVQSMSEYTCHTNLADINNDKQFQYIGFHFFFTNIYHVVVHV